MIALKVVAGLFWNEFDENAYCERFELYLYMCAFAWTLGGCCDSFVDDSSSKK